MITVVSVVGTRPDALKMAPVIRRLAALPDRVRQCVISTGQHREMLRQVLDVFEIQPDHSLDVMLPGQTLPQITSRVLVRLDPILEHVSPDLLIVQGDTTTTFAAALAAFYRQIPVGHVEAGLRTDNRYDPYPEELNRRLTAQLADLHFAPTARAAANLRGEGIDASSIFQVGNTVIDALLDAVSRPFHFADPELEQLTAPPARVILVTAHRRENLGAPLMRICEGIKRTVRSVTDAACVFQLHKNPAVRQVIRSELGSEPRVKLIEPQEYLPWVNLMRRADLILTDSGGIQEEAPALGKPVLVMRETTERPEGVAAGTARLVGTDPGTIHDSSVRLLTDRGAYDDMAKAVNPYGDGRSAERICDIILERIEKAVVH